MEFDEWLMHKRGNLAEKRIKRIDRAIEEMRIATDTPVSEGGNHLLSYAYFAEGQSDAKCILGEMEYVEKAINGDIKVREVLKKQFNKEVAA